MANPTFVVAVDDIGTFTFRHRTMRLEMAIQAEYSRLTEAVPTPTLWLDTVSTWLSELKILTERAPEGWDLEAMDPLEDETYQRLQTVHAKLREKEGSFRGKVAAGAQDGAAGGAVAAVPVEAAVQHAADGSPVP